MLHHAFGKGADAANPAGTLAVDVSGNLYGTSLSGGANGYGAVFQLSPPSRPRQQLDRDGALQFPRRQQRGVPASPAPRRPARAPVRDHRARWRQSRHRIRVVPAHNGRAAVALGVLHAFKGAEAAPIRPPG